MYTHAHVKMCHHCGMVVEPPHYCRELDVRQRTGATHQSTSGYRWDGKRVREHGRDGRESTCRPRSLSPAGRVVSTVYYARPPPHRGYCAEAGFATYEETREKLVALQQRLAFIKQEYTLRYPCLKGSHSPLPALMHRSRATPTSSHCLVSSEWHRATTPVVVHHHSPSEYYHSTVSTLDAQMATLKHEIAELEHRVSSKDATIYSMQRHEGTLRHENQRLNSLLDGINHGLESLRMNVDTHR